MVWVHPDLTWNPGKQPSTPPPVSSAGLLLQMAGRHTRYFRAHGLSSLPFGKGPGFSGWCVQGSHLAVRGSSVLSTYTATGVLLEGWRVRRARIPGQHLPSEFTPIVCQMGWRRRAQTSPSPLDARPPLCACAVCFDFFLGEEQVFHVFCGGPALRPAVVPLNAAAGIRGPSGTYQPCHKGCLA